MDRKSASPHIRALGEADLAAYKRLVYSNPQIFGLELPDVVHDYHKFICQTEFRRSYGAFLDNELLAVAGMYYWATPPQAKLDGLPFATMLGLRVAPHAPKIRVGLPALNSCLEALIDSACRKQVFQFYYLVPMRRHMDSNIGGPNPYVRAFPVLQKLDYYTEATIPAGTKPRCEHQWRIMGQRVWERDLVLRVMLLRDEFRHKYLLRNDAPTTAVKPANGYTHVSDQYPH